MNKSFWTYKSDEATPDISDALLHRAISANTTKDDWESLSPGMRRAIFRERKNSDKTKIIG